MRSPATPACSPAVASDSAGRAKAVAVGCVVILFGHVPMVSMLNTQIQKCAARNRLAVIIAPNKVRPASNRRTESSRSNALQQRIADGADVGSCKTMGWTGHEPAMQTRTEFDDFAVDRRTMPGCVEEFIKEPEKIGNCSFQQDSATTLKYFRVYHSTRHNSGRDGERQ